ncbi:alpha/beta hydrolase [Sulfurovum sp.]|uniref:alpha/beta fold hydrolase n=1 Tax=Sulfurovum sp. TaxID=1969726 RepID=UPI0025CC8CC2|nr:alpha/beta hydrolase [Sulfurovum sp.]
MIIEALNQTITLPDGRILGYAQAGDLNGSPLFLFHGLSSSRLEVNIVHDEMLKAGIRFIGVDRPGIGLSTFQKDRKISDFVEDIVHLADALGIDRFSVMGISAGAAYVYACIYSIPHRIISCDIVSGIAPVLEFGIDGMAKESRTTILIAQNLPWLIRPLFWFYQGRFSQDPAKADQFLESITFILDDVDKELLNDKTIKQVLLEPFRESFRQGSKGVAHDGILVFAKPWGFTLDDIAFFPINLWHGEKDRGVPVEMAQKVAAKLTNATLTVFPNEGHLSIVFNRFNEIVGALLENMNRGRAIYESKYCEVKYLESHHAVFCQWKAFCKGEDYRAPLRLGLELINKHEATTWITDTTHSFENEEADTKWLLEEFMPLMIESSVSKIIFIIANDSPLLDEIKGQEVALKGFFEVALVEDFKEIV